MDIDDLRGRLFTALASSLAAGCGPAVGSPDGESGSLSQGSGDADAATSSVADGHGTYGSTAASTTSTSAEADDDASPKFDLETRDVGLPTQCPPQPYPPVATCDAELPTEFHFFTFFCVELPVEGGCEDWAAQFEATYPDDQWPGWITDCLDSRDCQWQVPEAIGCGPLPYYADQCCFWFVTGWQQSCPGRPFLVAGRERVADPTARSDWAKGRPGVDALPCEIRSALADVWTQQALFEHASIASFSRFVLHLLACGAPADLVAAANVALGEEIEHAQLFFGFASHYAGAPVGPTALDVRDSLSPASLAFAEIVLAAVREGCIAETISAWHVALAARGASDPAMARVLEAVATQELDHAVLAWRFLDWAWTQADDDLRERIVETFAHADASAPRRASSATTLDDATLREHGLLPAELHARATRQALHDVVAPAVRRFLATRQRRCSGSAMSKSLIMASTSAMPMRT